MKNFFIGLLIGAGAILPGISSGVFLVVFELYEKIVDSILHFFRNVKKNFLFLYPLVLGALLSVFLFSKMLLFLFNKYYIYTSFAFIGLVLGSVPAIRRQADTTLKPNFFQCIFFILSLVLTIYLTLIEKQNIYYITSFSYLYLIFSGFLMSAGIIVPGVSKTAILMILGVYASYLTAISTLDFNFLIPIGIGLAFGSVIFMYIINFLFSHYKSYTYFAILGFIIGSCFIIWPGFNLDLEHIVGILIGIICFYLVRKLDRIK